MECTDDTDTNHIRVLPDACVEIFINYTDTPIAVIDNKEFQCSIVNARMSKPMDVQMRKGSGCLAICFFPGMAYKFFHAPMYLFSDTTIMLEDIWDDLATRIVEDLANSTNNSSRVAIVQQILTNSLKDNAHDQQVVDCLQQIELSEKSLTVNQLVYLTGMSQRQLSRRFQQIVGLSPKEYLRVQRFIRSLKHLKRYPEHSLTEIAYESNYYDQAHFNRDYKAYTGCTPGEVTKSPHFLY